MIIRTPTRQLRVRAMYPGERPLPRIDAIGLYYPQHPREIAIKASLSPKDQAEVLIHEIIHSIYDEWEIPTRASEETVCTKVSAGLAEIIKANPDVVAALGLALTEGVPIVGASN